MKGLIIRPPWIDLILDDVKSWEIRGSNPKVRGEIALIQSGTKTVVGVAELVDSRPLSLEDYLEAEPFHCIRSNGDLPYPQTFAWCWKIHDAYPDRCHTCIRVGPSSG